MCLVEVGMRDAKTGQISMLPKLATACNTIGRDGMVLVTDSEKVRQARARIKETLLLQHPIDGPICHKAGKCLLQDDHLKDGREDRRAEVRPFTSRRRDLGSNVTLFVDRCVMCSRCVRFTREVSGTCELIVAHRGAREQIDVMPGVPLDNKLSGNVVDLCPVGALVDKDFLCRQRVGLMRRHAGVCTGCAAACSIWIEESQDRVCRIKPRENPFVNRWWICNEGRYGYSHVHSDERLTRPLCRDGADLSEAVWSRLPHELSGALARARPLAAVLSPHLTVEEAYLLCKYIRQLDQRAPLVLGPVPAVGEDEHFPGRFTISAEKCPNRRGVEAILAHFGKRVTTFEELLPQLDEGAIQGVWVSGGYKTDWIDRPTAARFEKLPLLVVQDLFASPLSERATYRLPAPAFPERDGSYVNRADRLQSAGGAIRPPSGVRPEGTLFWELLGRQGLYDARAVLSEIAAEISYFSAAGGPVPDVGIDLKVNLLADASADAGSATA